MLPHAPTPSLAYPLHDSKTLHPYWLVFCASDNLDGPPFFEPVFHFTFFRRSPVVIDVVELWFRAFRFFLFYKKKARLLWPCPMNGTTFLSRYVMERGVLFLLDVSPSFYYYLSTCPFVKRGGLSFLFFCCPRKFGFRLNCAGSWKQSGDSLWARDGMTYLGEKGWWNFTLLRLLAAGCFVSGRMMISTTRDVPGGGGCCSSCGKVFPHKTYDCRLCVGMGKSFGIGKRENEYCTSFVQVSVVSG